MKAGRMREEEERGKGAKGQRGRGSEGQRPKTKD